MRDDRIKRSLDVTRAAVRHNTETQEMLKGALAEMNPFAFEQLIGELLSAMGGTRMSKLLPPLEIRVLT